MLTEEETIDNIIEKLIEDADKEDSPDTQLAAVKGINCVILTLNVTILDKLIANGSVPVLLKCCKQNVSMKLKEEAIRLLANISAGSTEHIKVVINAGILPILRSLLNSTHLEICEEAARACLNIVVADRAYSDQALEVNVMRAIISLHDRFPETDIINRRIACILRYMCQAKLCVNLVRILAPVLLSLLQRPDMDVKLDALYAIVYTANADIIFATLLNRANAVENLLQFLDCTEVKVLVVALSVIGCLINGFPKPAQFLLENNFLRYIETYIDHENRLIQKGGLFCVTALMSNNVDQIEAVINAGLITKIMNYLQNDDCELKEQSLRALLHFTEVGSCEQIFTLIKEDYVIHLCTLLKNCEEQLVILVLQSILSLYKYCGLLFEIVHSIIDNCDITDRIEYLLKSENVHVKELTNKFINETLRERP